MTRHVVLFSLFLILRDEESMAYQSIDDVRQDGAVYIAMS